MTNENPKAPDKLEPAVDSPETLAALKQFTNLLNKASVAPNTTDGAVAKENPELLAAAAQFAGLLGKAAAVPDIDKKDSSSKSDK